MIKKIFGFVDYFLPPDIVEELDLTTLYRLRVIIITGLLAVVFISLLLMIIFAFEMSLTIKIAAIVAFLCVFTFLVFSKSLKKGHVTYFELGAQLQLVLLSVLVYAAVISEKGMGIFGLIWMAPMLLIAPFYFKRKLWFLYFGLNALSIAAVICYRYDTFFVPIERIEFFRSVYVFYVALILINVGALAFLFVQMSDILRYEINRQKEIIHESAKFQSLVQMSSNLAHDINNPLFTIQGKMHQIRNNLSEGQLTLERCDAIIEDVENIILKLSQVVKGVSTFARQNDRGSMSQIKVREILKGVALITTDRFKQNEITFDFNADENLVVHCYPPYVTQILLNLIQNAIDAVESASNKIVRVDVVKGTRSIEFHVIDSGPGVDPSIVSDLFKPFVTTKKSSKGTGLGLSISKGLVELHKGQLIYKRVGQWTYFIVKIPTNE